MLEEVNRLNWWNDIYCVVFLSLFILIVVMFEISIR